MLPVQLVHSLKVAGFKTVRRVGVTYGGFPIAVLVNGSTASAGEIVAACLQDHQRAKIVGERTYGRGIVQGIFPLSSGGGALKLTTAKFVRPSGKKIHRFSDAKESDEWGVMPDGGFEIRLSDAEREKARERRENRTADDAEGSASDDRQLNKALAYVRDQLRRR